METMASILARMTKQNWNLLEKVRIAALLYNLGMLTIDNETLQKHRSPEEVHKLLSGALKEVSSILREADLVDIMDMFNGAIGERNSFDKRMLMGKDIINGSNMLNLADIFSTLVEERRTQPDMTCQDILDEVKRIAEAGGLYLPMVHMMEDFIEDIEARVSSNQIDITKRYQNIISRFNRLKARSSVMVD
jgi:response regulator RpfG family c-di-GMP phosphodiesterase